MVKVCAPCSKEAEIAEIHTIVLDIQKILKGNGQPGLIQHLNDTNSRLDRQEGATGIMKWLFGGGAILTAIGFILTKLRII